jgi:hypothetical protein
MQAAGIPRALAPASQLVCSAQCSSHMVMSALTCAAAGAGWQLLLIQQLRPAATHHTQHNLQHTGGGSSSSSIVVSTEAHLTNNHAPTPHTRRTPAQREAYVFGTDHYHREYVKRALKEHNIHPAGAGAAQRSLANLVLGERLVTCGSSQHLTCSLERSWKGICHVSISYMMIA